MRSARFYACFPHQVEYESRLREALRLLQSHSERLQRGRVVGSAPADLDLAAHRVVTGRVGLLLSWMSDSVGAESARLGAWGVLGEATGGLLLDPVSQHPLATEELVGEQYSPRYDRIER